MRRRARDRESAVDGGCGDGHKAAAVRESAAGGGAAAATGRGAATERFVCCGLAVAGDARGSRREALVIVQVRDPSPSNVIGPKVLLRPSPVQLHPVYFRSKIHGY
jgi:hypothetical protein